MPEHPDVVVVGAGVVGAACALELARARLRVLVLDADFAGGGSTGAAMGHLVVMDDSEEQLAFTALSRTLWAEFAPAMGADCEYRRTGTLWIAASEAEWEAAQPKRETYVRHGVRAELLDARALAEVEPELRPGLAGALFVPEDAVLYPPAAARWLLSRARDLGAEVRERSTAVEIGSGVVTVRSAAGSSDRVTAGAIVVAAGAFTPRLLPGLPVVPRKGHLVITDRQPPLCRSQLVELGYLRSAHTMDGSSIAFNVQPRATGQLLIGSSRELVGLDGRVNRPLVRDMMRRAVEFLPRLARSAALRIWTGFRPATADKLPLIGAWPLVPGVWVATGHEGLGITLAPATGRLLAALITGAAPPIDAAPFAPHRAMPADAGMAAHA